MFRWGRCFSGGIDMRFLWRSILVSLGCLTLLLLSGGWSRAADDKDDVEFERKDFPTFDKANLTGTFYPSKPEAGKKDRSAVVLLVHDFSHAKGGGRNQTGLTYLAGQLQKECYAVLTFDFRGFGDSKGVDAKEFWGHPLNRNLRGAGRARSSIDQKEFPAGYYMNLINDIAAARSYLSALNDSRDVNVNASNLIVIGAGQGATLAALWMAAECRRQRVELIDTNPGAVISQKKMVPIGRPESASLRAAVFLTISPDLETRALGTPLRKALVDVAQTAHIPTYFLYGKNDAKAAKLVTTYMDAIQTMNYKKVESKDKEKAIPGTDLAGSQLLGPRLKTTEYIIEFVNRVMDDRGTLPLKEREEEKSYYCYMLPWP